MRSSRQHNEPDKFFRGRVNVRSLTWGLLTFCSGLLLVGVGGLANNNGVMAIIILMGSVLSALKAYKYSDHLYGGQFVGHNKEVLEARIKRWQGLSEGGFLFESLPFGNFSENQERFSDMKVNTGYDPQALYRVSASHASEVIGFDLRDYRTEDKPEPSLYSGSYHNLYQRLLRVAPPGAVLQFVISAKDHQSDFIRSHRPILIEKGIKEVAAYLLVGLNSSVVTPAVKGKILTAMQGFRRLSRAEIASHNESVAHPNIRGSGLRLPFYAATGLTDGDYVQTSVSGQITAAVALGMLPKESDEFFYDYLEPIRHLNGTIVTRFLMSDVASATSILKSVRDHNKEQDGTASFSELAAAEAVQRADAADDLMSAHMDIFALIHGDKDRVDEAIGRLHSPKLARNVGEEARARIVQVLGHSKDAHAICMAGSYHYLRERLQKVIRYSEAALYCPLPQTPNTRLAEHTLALRNEDQSVEYIDISHSDKSLFNAIVGPPGTGKSAMVSGIIRSHELREELKGIRTATLLLDIGSSQRWRTENLGADDIIFDLAKDADGNWIPLPIHPLEALMFDGGKSDTDINNGRDYVCDMLDLDPEDVSVASSVGVVRDAVMATVAMGYPYSMSRLHLNLEKKAEEAAQSFSGSERERFSSAWLNFTAFIKRFTRGNEFGSVYDPLTTTRKSLRGITFFYANVESQQKDPRDLNSAFLRLCHRVAYVIADRYGPFSKVEHDDNKRSILWIVDEYNWQKAFINERKTTDMADQCRKFGIIAWVLVQNFKYLIIKDAAGHEDYSLFQVLAKILFYDDGGEGNRDILTVLGNSEAGGRAISRVAERIRERYASFGEHSVGYLDEHRRLKRLLVDWEWNFLWAITTHSGGMKVRNFVASELGISRKAAADLLAAYGPRKIPKTDLSLEKMRAVVDAIKREERFHG